jgi:hypothetical protein
MLRDVRAEKVFEALEIGEIESGSGLKPGTGFIKTR